MPLLNFFVKKPKNLTKRNKLEKSPRKSVIAEAYDMAVKNDWHAGEAAIWATKKHGSKINKSDIQYFAMKSKMPYLEELVYGVRTIIQ